MPLPSVGADDLLLKVHCAGVCGSDLHILAGTSSYADRVVLGHEMVGTVAALGENIEEEKSTDWKIGEVVAVCPQYSCGGECRQCRKGRSNFCERGGYESTVGYFRDGCFAEFVSVHWSQVHKLSLRGQPMEVAVLSEPFNCLLNGMKKLGSALLLHDDDQEFRVLIMGGGICGLLWSALFCARGIRLIVLTEPREGRRDIAEKYLVQTLGLSAAKACHPDDLGPFEKFDIVIECCGQAQAVAYGYNRLDTGGTLLIFGGPPKGSQITIDPSDLLFKELSIKGTVIGQDTFEKGIEALLNLAEKGHLDWKALGCRFFELEEYETAFERLNQGDICKAIFSITSC
jgi:L-iditol 2-dehydrogenase